MKYITNYSNKYKNKQFDNILDLHNVKLKNKQYDFVYGLKLYNTNNDNIHFVKLVNKSKKVKNVFYINKYTEYYTNEIEYLPFNTKYYATQKIEGTSIFISNFEGKIVSFKKKKDLNKNINNKFFDDLEYKYLISKYNDYIFEFKIGFNGVVYLVNMFSISKFISYSKLREVADFLDVKVPKKVNFDYIKDGGLVTFNYMYNDYFLDDYDVMPEKTYMLNFFFKNNKYLFAKICI